MPSGPSDSPDSFQRLFVDAVGYWEPRRLIYNLVLALLVLGCWGQEILAEGPVDWLLALVFFGVLALVANLLYCLAYPVDVVLQLTPLQAIWRRLRWLLFSSGLAIASGLALWMMLRPGMA